MHVHVMVLYLLNALLVTLVMLVMHFWHFVDRADSSLKATRSAVCSIEGPSWIAGDDEAGLALSKPCCPVAVCSMDGPSWMTVDFGTSISEI